MKMQTLRRVVSALLLGLALIGASAWATVDIGGKVASPPHRATAPPWRRQRSTGSRVSPAQPMIALVAKNSSDGPSRQPSPV